MAVGFLGSTGTTEFSAASDYDLLLLAADYPAGYGIEATIIDHRIADIVILGADEATTGWNAATMTDREWAASQWLARTRPVHDPDQVLRRSRDRAVELCRRRPPVSDRQQHTTRAFISHDLRVNEALLRRSHDPVARMALGM